MSEPPRPAPPGSEPERRPDEDEPVVCERCGSGSVYRMHAVWRCADCGYKTDCCGW
jgi:ribosomal protein L37AE/L43A